MSLFNRLPEQLKQQDFLSFYHHETNGRSKIRLLALHHLQQGRKLQDVADLVAFPRQTIWEWVRWYQEEGIERLCSRPKNRGRKRKLSKRQESLLPDIVETLQKERPGGKLTADDINDYLQKEWDISYAPGSLYTVLHRLKLSWITGRSQHPQSDPAAQAAFKK